MINISLFNMYKKSSTTSSNILLFNLNIKYIFFNISIMFVSEFKSNYYCFSISFFFYLFYYLLIIILYIFLDLKYNQIFK